MLLHRRHSFDERRHLRKRAMKTDNNDENCESKYHSEYDQHNEIVASSPSLSYHIQSIYNLLSIQSYSRILSHLSQIIQLQLLDSNLITTYLSLKGARLLLDILRSILERNEKTDFNSRHKKRNLPYFISFLSLTSPYINLIQKDKISWHVLLSQDFSNELMKLLTRLPCSIMTFVIPWCRQFTRGIILNESWPLLVNNQNQLSSWFQVWLSFCESGHDWDSITRTMMRLTILELLQYPFHSQALFKQQVSLSLIRFCQCPNLSSEMLLDCCRVYDDCLPESNIEIIMNWRLILDLQFNEMEWNLKNIFIVLRRWLSCKSKLIETHAQQLLQRLENGVRLEKEATYFIYCWWLLYKFTGGVSPMKKNFSFNDSLMKLTFPFRWFPLTFVWCLNHSYPCIKLLQNIPIPTPLQGIECDQSWLRLESLFDESMELNEKDEDFTINEKEQKFNFLAWFMLYKRLNLIQVAFEMKPESISLSFDLNENMKLILTNRGELRLQEDDESFIIEKCTERSNTLVLTTSIRQYQFETDQATRINASYEAIRTGYQQVRTLYWQILIQSILDIK